MHWKSWDALRPPHQHSSTSHTRKEQAAMGLLLCFLLVTCSSLESEYEAAASYPE